MKRIINLTKQIFAIACICIFAMMQTAIIMPDYTYAETAGDVLIVRVQYFGESASKIREKVRFTRAELEAMGAETYYYSNITSVGTVMSLAARGPKVLTIIEKAGIDINSVKAFTFKTTDGYTRNFNVPNHLNSTRYYYPNLSSMYERDDDNNMTLLEGSTKGKTAVPAILALECGESKAPGKHAEDISMSTTKAYRFCMGQSLLMDGKKVDLGKEVTSIDSCHSIYGIDITLEGSPDDKGAYVDDKGKIGSKDKKREGKSSKNKVVSKNKDAKSSKKTYIKTREIILGDKIVEDQEIATEINVLNDVEQYKQGTGLAVGIGTGTLFGLGAIFRIIKFRKRF